VSETPVIKCPFTGETVEIREVSLGDMLNTGFMGVVNSKIGGYTTRIFMDKRLLIDFLRTRNGVLKGKPMYVSIEVKDRESATSAGLSAEELRKERDLDATAEKTADTIMRAVHNTRK
jgi:hypothetical protein